MLLATLKGRLPRMLPFLSRLPVGFTAGAALLIAAKQLRHFFGVEMDGHGHFHDILIRFGLDKSVCARCPNPVFTECRGADRGLGTEGGPGLAGGT
jgi:hypothetical protein